jgi:hypothetical protein
MRDGFPAGGTPGRPEIKEHHFPFKLGKGDILAIKGFEGEIEGQIGGGLFFFFNTMEKKQEAYHA